MTIKNAGSPLSISEINTELGLSASSERKLGWTSSRRLAGSPQSIESASLYYNDIGVLLPYSSFTVPANVNGIRLPIVVGGGGGGGGYVAGGSNSDTHAGGGGGSGSSVTGAILLVQPGDVISYTLGHGGTSASVAFHNGTWIYIGSAGQSGAYGNGGDGGNTTVMKNGVIMIQAYGGKGGTYGGPGDNCAGVSGAGGSTPYVAPEVEFDYRPLGTAGGAINCNRNAFPATLGGAGTAYGAAVYGTGGNSWSSGVGADSAPTEGRDGGIVLEYTIRGVPVEGQISMSQFYGRYNP